MREKYLQYGLAAKAGRGVCLLLLVSIAVPAFGQTGAYTLSGGSATQANATYAGTSTDQSAVYVLNGGVLTLNSPTLTKTGNSSDVNKSSQYGLNAGVLAASGGSVTITGGSVNTNSSGSNGLFATGTGSVVSMSNGSIITNGTASHGVDVTYGGTVKLTDMTVTTYGDSASAGLSTDFGGGTVIFTRGTVTTAGGKSPAMYSTGSVSATDATLVSNGGPGAVIDGANAISITNSSLTGKTYGMKLFRSANGSGTATVSVDGGSIASTAGDLFYVTANTGLSTAANITVKNGAKANASTSYLLTVDTSSTGNLTLIGETLTGNIQADSTAKANVTLQSGTTLTGILTRSSLTLDSTSTWIVLGNSTLTSLVDASGVSGSSINNIQGNGYTVTYDATLSANSYLKGGNYTLAGGGVLVPAGSVVTLTPTISSGGITSAATGTAGVAPNAWIAIYGSNLASATAATTSANLVNGSLPTSLSGTSVTINGKAAYINYVSPTQINVLAPSDTATGTVTVTVATSAGSGSQTVTMFQVLPGFFTEGTNILAVRPSDATIINGTGAPVPGYSTSASAKPGDVLELFATGLGATMTAPTVGSVFSGAYPTVTIPMVTIGGAPSPVSLSGLVGAGLYQLNITVPATLAPGTYPVVVMQNGTSSPPTATLTIASK